MSERLVTENVQKSGIYAIQNILDGKVYIGQAADLQKRQKQHFGFLRRGNHPNIHLQRAYNRDGNKNFDFLPIEYATPETLEAREQDWLDNTPANKRYNICISSKSCLGVKRREETKLTQSELKKKFRPEWLFTPDSRAKARKKFKAGWHTHKQRHTPESIAKRIATVKARWAVTPKSPPTEETRQKMSASAKRRWIEKPISKEITARAKLVRAATLAKKHG